RAKYADTSTNGCVHRKSPHQRCEKGFAPTSIGGPTYRLMDGGVVKRRRKTFTKLPDGRAAGGLKMTSEDKRFAGVLRGRCVRCAGCLRQPFSSRSNHVASPVPLRPRPARGSGARLHGIFAESCSRVV